MLLGADSALAQSNTDSGGGVIILIVIVAALIIFMIPTIVAFNRRHPNRWPIALINVIFGGTGLGWFGSLIWAFSAIHKSPTGSNGGESGLNLFVNDPKMVALVNDASTPSAPDQLIQRLEKLKRLHEQGVVADDEFERLKRPILDAMLKDHQS